MRIDLRIVTTVMLVAAMLGAGASAAQAQTNHEVNAAIQFNFSNPGARSLAMGGSLTGLADDATAALTNPSALPLLPSPEVSGEFRAFHFSTAFTAAGNAGTPTNIGVDTVQGLVRTSTDDSSSAPSFFSFVLPREKWGIAVYRHQLSKLEATVETDGAFATQPSLRRLLPVSATMDLAVASWGVSAAVKAGAHVYVGGGVSFAQLDLESRTNRFCLCLTGSGSALQPGGTFGAPLKTTANTRFIDGQSGSGSAPAFNAGVTIQAHPRFSLGASYRQGPKFEDIDITVERGQAAGGGDVGLTTSGVFKVPDVISFGAVAKPNLVFRQGDVLRLAAEVRQVTYSDLTDGIVLSVSTNDDPANYTVDNGQELRFGAEYLFVGESTVALRGGVWRDPDHRITYRGSDPLAAASFQAGSDEWHYTVGGGIAVGRHAQVDVGYDRATTINTFSVSFVARF
jgi:long-subunit fatty acid transport protein